MTKKRIIRKYTDEFREEAVALVTQQGYSVTEAAKSLGITTKLIYNWKDKLTIKNSEDALSSDKRTELIQLREDNKRLLMERERLKKRLLCERNEVKYDFIKKNQIVYSALSLCKVMNVSHSAYYTWLLSWICTHDVLLGGTEQTHDS